MRPVVALMFPLALAACATQQEICIYDAQQESEVLRELIRDTRANLARGYAVRTEQVVETVEKECVVSDGLGGTMTDTCSEVEVTETIVPVAIDLDAEAAKLESLERRYARERDNLQEEIARCRALYPEEEA